MSAIRGTQDWPERCSKLMTPEDEAQLLADILDASEHDTVALERLARSQECSALLRCAAVDKYVEIKGMEAKPLLSALADFRTEGSEDIRMVAYQWLSSLESPQVVRVRGGAQRTRVGTQATDMAWRQQAARDPSPRIRWLASLPERAERT